MNINSHISHQSEKSKWSCGGKTLNSTNDEYTTTLRNKRSNNQSFSDVHRQSKYQAPIQFSSQYEIPMFQAADASHHKLIDNSLRIITTQIRRLRGTCHYLSKNIDCPIIYEIFGRCVSKGDTFTNIPGMSFVLQENGNKHTAQKINCALYDFDEILPDVRVGNIYRCAGRYHCQKYIFQCFNIEELDEKEVHLMESIQYQSSLELTELTKPEKLTRKSNRVSKNNVET